VAVTDHHQPKESGLPQADAIAHPALAGRAAPLAAAGLCGSAVAWKTAWAALAAWRKAQGGGLTAEDKEHLKDSMVLAALGTVADVVPLHGENRLLVRHGLARLGGTADEGLKAILAVCGLGGLVLAEDVGFKIGPRFNAAGRLGQAMRVVELLTGTGTGAGGPEAMAELAGHLDWANRTRQRIEREIVAEAREQAEAQVEAGRAALVVSSPHWHPGVIGIVASRLVERFQRPALVVSFGTASGLGYGSGRSTPSLPLHAALAACTRHLAVHGGHAMAAGFKVRPESLDAFREAFWAHASGTFGGVPPPQPLVMEANMSLGDVTAGLVRDLERLEPHGAGNPRPLFYLGGCRIESARVIGQDGTHLSLTVSHPTSRSVRCIAFGMAERKDELRGFVDLAAVPRINEWQGRVSAELEIKDIRQAEARRPGQGGGDA
jgi:single-stranded-DNA-specific exonuclease